MWKCKKCGIISKGSIYVSDGYCRNCKEFCLLERYDDLEKESNRYELICGKYDFLYIYDKKENKKLTLQDVYDLLNKLERIVKRNDL